MGRDETDHDLLDMIIAQRTDSYVLSKLLGLSQLVLVARDGLLEGAVPLWSYHWPFDGWRIYGDGSSTFSVCVSSELLQDEREGRRPMAWLFPA